MPIETLTTRIPITDPNTGCLTAYGVRVFEDALRTVRSQQSVADFSPVAVAASVSALGFGFAPVSSPADVSASITPVAALGGAGPDFTPV